MAPRNAIVWILALGLAVRLILAPYTQFSHVTERINSADHIFLLGFNPLINDAGVGSGFLIFFVPPYLAYLGLSALGLHFQFILELLFKLPPIIGDVLVFMSLRQLTLIGLKDSTKSSLVAASYFLNPYVINVSAIIGSNESLMVAFVLQAILALFRGQEQRSAIYLSTASFMRYFPFLLTPLFAIFAWKRERRSAARFLAVFSAFSFFLSLPYLSFLIPLYQASPQSFLDWTRYFFGAGGSAPAANPWPVWQFKWNLTGFLIITGLISQASSIFLNLRTFLILLIVITFLALRRLTLSVEYANTYFLSFFLLVLVLFPLSQYHYLVWVIPFALLASIAFKQFPLRYVSLLWISYMVIDLAIQGAFLGYLDYTFPTALSQTLRNYWSTTIYNVPLQHSFGALIWLVMAGLLLRAAFALATFRPWWGTSTDRGNKWDQLANAGPENRKSLLSSSRAQVLLSLSIVVFAYLAILAREWWATTLFFAYSSTFVLFTALRVRSTEFTIQNNREKSRRRNPFHTNFRFSGKILGSILIASILLSFVPLAVAINGGFIPNTRTYSSFGDTYRGVAESSLNSMQNVNGTVLGIDRSQTSWATWRLTPASVLFAGSGMRKALTADIRITGVPVSRSGVYVEAFSSTGLPARPYDWHETGGSGAFASNGTVTVPSGATFFSISSDPGEWFSSDKVSTIELNVSIVRNAAWSLSVFRDNEWWTPQDNRDPNLVHTSDGLFTFYVPPGHVFRFPSLFVRPLDNSTSATVKFDSLQYLSVNGAARVSVSLGSQIVYWQKLDYQSSGVFHLPPEPKTSESIAVPLNTSLLSPTTIVNVTIDRNALWPVQSVILELSAPISASFSVQFTPLSIILSGLSVAIAIIPLAGKLSKRFQHHE